jgi:hypothetical protein
MLARIAATLFLLSSGLYLNAQTESHRDVAAPLQKLRAVSVTVGLTPDVGRLFSKETIKVDVELRLRRNGIAVSDNSPDVLGIMLFGSADAEDVRRAGWVTHMRVNMSRVVRVLANDAVTSAEVWSTQGLSWGGPDERHAAQIRRDLGDFVDRFVNDYLTANPK